MLSPIEIIAPNPHAKLALHLHSNTPDKTSTRKPRTQIQLPLHRPEYNPPKPIRITAVPKNPKTKPVTTTSDVLLLMDSLELPIPVDIYASLIQECARSGDPLKATEMHEHVIRSGLPASLPLTNRILLMYVACGCLGHARQVFDQMLVRDFNSWALVIAGCVENEKHDEAIKLFVKMLREKGFENVGRNQMALSVSGILVCVLKSCLCTMDFELGVQVHGWLWKMGYSRSLALISFLINYYGKVKCSDGAESVFRHVRSRNTAVWTSRIVNYCNYENFDEVISVYKDMGREGVRKNGYTFSTVLKACTKMGDIGCGRQVHANVLKLGLESNSYVQCALVDLYGKCGFLKDAICMFEIDRDKRSCACFNAMVTNYILHGLCFEAIKVLYEMQTYGFKPLESLFGELKLVCGSKDPENDIASM